MSLFFVNIRFQIAACCFLIIIIINYIHMRKLNQLSTRWFNVLLIFTSTYLLFDMITVYTVTHMDTVPPLLNDICHRLFILFMVCVIISLYFYIEALGRKQKRLTAVEVCKRLIPFFLALVLIVFGSVDYYYGENGAYAHGVMPSVSYIIAAVYIVMIFSRTCKFSKTLRSESITVIRFGLLIWVVAAIVQLFNPTLLVSGLAIVLLIFFVYLSFQNPKELVDSVAGSFNERALGYSLEEHLASGKPFLVVGILMKDIVELNSLLGTGNGRKMLAEIAHEMEKQTSTATYHSGRTFKMFFEPKHFTYEIKEELIRCLNKERTVNGTQVRLTSVLYLMECPKYAKTPEAFSELDSFLMKTLLPELHESQFVEVDDTVMTTYHRNTAVNKCITEALREDGLEVVYQPIYDTASAAFSSAEALVRMKNTGELGFVSPEEFVPMAEKNGLIAELGKVVFRKVCRFGEKYSLQERGVHYIEVNLSGIQIVDENICTQLQSIMKEFGTKPSFINLEITESAAVEFKDILQKNMKCLREMGCSFSMDDFGTGYSNIAQIAQVKYDLIKLDKSLLWPCFGTEDPEKALYILESLVDLIHKMGVRIVSEGVETQEQVDLLTRLGVEYLQGYYFSRPLSEADYAHFLERNFPS